MNERVIQQIMEALDAAADGGDVGPTDTLHVRHAPTIAVTAYPKPTCSHEARPESIWWQLGTLLLWMSPLLFWMPVALVAFGWRPWRGVW